MCAHLDFAVCGDRLIFDTHAEAATKALVAKGATKLYVGITERITQNTYLHMKKQRKKGFKVLWMIVVCAGATWCTEYGTNTCPERRARRVIERLQLHADGAPVQILNSADKDGAHSAINRPAFGEHVRAGDSATSILASACKRLLALRNGGTPSTEGAALFGTEGGCRKRPLEDEEQKAEEEGGCEEYEDRDKEDEDDDEDGGQEEEVQEEGGGEGSDYFQSHNVEIMSRLVSAGNRKVAVYMLGLVEW
jgi:hypothetical protein